MDPEGYSKPKTGERGRDGGRPCRLDKIVCSTLGGTAAAWHSEAHSLESEESEISGWLGGAGVGGQSQNAGEFLRKDVFIGSC